MEMARTKTSPTISVCMIVKNEESCLARCLDSIRDFVDEIIVVDTGSTDATVQIARQYTNEIYFHPWENDFSKHRNQSLSYATGDWIFQIDADEELFMEDGHKLRETVAAGSADFYFLRFYDLKKDGAVHGIFNLIRLFRNGMGMQFTQKVHNQLQIKGAGVLSSIRVKHYGYDLSKEKMEAKHNRTTTLLKEMLETDPDDAYSRHQLTSSYSMHMEFDKVIEHGEMVLNLMRRKGLRNDFIITTFYTVAQAYYALANLEAAERIGREALEFFPRHIDICHLLAAIYFKKRSLDQCLSMSYRYLDIYEKFTQNPSLIGSFYCHSPAKRHEVFFGLACVNFYKKNFEKADEFFRKSFEDSGRKMEKAKNICRFYLEQQMDSKALQWLIRAHEKGLVKEGERLSDSLPSIEDLGPLAYEVAELFCRRRQWHLAEKALSLAVHISPAGFNHNKFDGLLRAAELQTVQT